MKKIFKPIIVFLLSFTLSFGIVGCGANTDNNTKQESSKTTTTNDDVTEETGLWANATYIEDTELGEGAITVSVEVKAEEKSITFTVHTDKDILGDALLEHSLLAGDESEYGLYVKEVNGIKADYDTDKAYWAFYKDGEYMNTGVDSTNIADGEHYELVYTKD